MAHEMSKKHQEQVAEKTAILVNHAFRMGIQAERSRIIELIQQELETLVQPSEESEVIHKVIDMLKESTVND
jgi:hypothetical protein